MPKKELQSVSPDGVYGLNWGSDGYIHIIFMETGETVVFLLDNYPRWTVKAAFSHGMRRLMCLNADGSVCTWKMPPKANRTWRDKNIVEYLFFCGEGCSQYRRGDLLGHFQSLRLGF